MNSLSLRLPSRRTGYVAAAFTLLFATITSAFASAAQITERSIELSSSAAGATGVSYQVNFTPNASTNAGALVIEFCKNTPLIGEACTAPTGFSVASATAAGFTPDASPYTNANKITLTGTVTAGSAFTLTLAGVTNPTSSTDPLYARIVTYDTTGDAETYTSTNIGSGSVDTGSVAIGITDKIGVSAAVLESMIFCVSKAVPTQNCGGVTAPTLTLGEDVGGGVIALSPSAVSTGDIYTQISTNAASGAIVRLQSNATSCGGLLRAGAAGACDITPALHADSFGDSSQGIAKFGVKVASAADPTGTGTPNGTFQVANGATYNGTTYEMNYVSGNGSGVTSTYGDPILDTAGAAITNRNMKLTFGVSAANNTPAGKYSADLGLIATGKF